MHVGAPPTMPYMLSRNFREWTVIHIVTMAQFFIIFIAIQEAMENFVFPYHMQGMLILVKWHEWEKEKRYIIPIWYGNKIIIGFWGLCCIVLA